MLQPSVTDLLNRAAAAERSGQPTQALAAFHAVLQIDPGHPGALLRVALSLRQQGALLEAENALVQAAQRSAARALGAAALPIFVELISLLQHTRQYEKALNVIERGLSQFGELPGLVWEQCECLDALGQSGKRLQRLNRLAALQPNDPVVLIALGKALLSSAAAPSAIKPLRAALSLGYQDEAVSLMLAGLEIHVGELAAAETRLRAMLLERPNHLGVLGHLLSMALNRCDWHESAALEARVLTEIEQGHVHLALSPWTLLGTHASPDLLLRYNRAFNEATRAAAPALPSPKLAHDPTRRLRVGYLSSDFNAHATAMLMTRLFELHDQSRFECFAYSYGARVEDAYRTRLKNAFEHWRDINDVSDAQAAAVIARDNIDVLVELKGHTYGARLGITDLRPAPIQLHYLGFPGSVARSSIEYIVADETIAPSAHDRHYAEKVFRLPRSYQANDPLRARPNAVPRSELGLPEHALVLCNFNATYKLRETFVRIWFDALSKSPHALLWLLDPGKVGRDNLLALARTMGCAEQIVFAPRVAPSEHLARLAAADLALDQLPCGSHTTGSDALWMGVPMITCLGDTFHGRVGASLLRAVELPEFVAQSEDGYRERLAAFLAAPSLIAKAKMHLAERHRNLPLFDTAAFTRDWEDMLYTLTTTEPR